MAEKEESPYPMAANEESSLVTENSRALRKKKRMKCIAFFVAFTIFQTVVILVFVLTVLRFKSPKFSVRSGSFDNDTFQIGMESDAAPSFNLTMNTQFGVKNTDFGHFNYEMSTVTFEYRGTAVGMVSVDKARTRARTTRKFDAKLLLKTDSMADESFEQLGGDISSGKVPLTSSSSFT
ncbi:uncharacterized protein LOC110658144 [Hevea brasiliensis]|uniref:uncharacterized protein LOC110658144 n=1 Tax=Hevea brasiliensis TaxID=3981 RepID=UPI0025F2A2CF|nr:uncharacterized protein LOC110658144 [Hevea brasiliensis]